jgi:hypothetical protein
LSPKILILLALIFLGVAVIFGAQSYTFVNSSHKTEARVKKIKNGGKMVTPIFEYYVKGKYYEYEGASTSHGQYEINDKETIYYDPSEPENGTLGSFMNLWFVPVFCGGFFIILLFVGIASAFSKKSYTI